MTVEPPVTRAERQARTRDRLVEVARRLFLADGYNATSLDRVALEAGFSKGAVYSNFSGKEELCLAVLDEIRTEQVDRVMAAFTADDDLDGRIDAFAGWAREHLGNPRWTALEVELAGVARHSAFVRDELVVRHQALVDAAAALLERVTEEAGVRPALPERRAAVALLSLGIGLGSLRSLDASLDADIYAETMRALLRGSATAAGESGGGPAVQ